VFGLFQDRTDPLEFAPAYAHTLPYTFHPH
jgi:hypothetical protein